MTYEKVMSEVQAIFRDIMDNPALELQPGTTSDDIEEWDSLTHIQLVVAIEKHFRIMFTSEEIGGYLNVGQMCEGIVKKLG